MFNKGDVMKKRIYEIIEVSKEDDITSHIYDHDVYNIYEYYSSCF